MPPDKRRLFDHDRMTHMLESAQRAHELVQGKTRADLKSDDVLCLALMRLIEIIGEAAFHVSEDGHKLLPELPWDQIINMRHRIVHGYYEVDLNILWDTVEIDLPPMIAVLRNAVGRA
jgi:uncharacterized protein with HEPN domain